MSARDDIAGYVLAHWTATPVLLLDDYVSLEDLPAGALEAMQLVLDFPSATDEIATIAVHQVNGFRVRGFVQSWLLSPLGGDPAAARGLGEDFRQMMRGRRAGATVIETVDSFSATGGAEGKWLMFGALLHFYRDEFA